ncbi:MAG: hypothetical protein ACSHX6_07835 [Akkermansiaceae bacterium]
MIENVSMTPEKITNIETRNAAIRELAEDGRDVDDGVIFALCDVICEPDEIENTNGFASLLGEISDARFIEPLIAQIGRDDSRGTSWLADYLYALILLLEEEEDYYEVSDDFIHLLGGLLLNTGGGELSWKAGDVLMRIENPLSKGYVIQGVVDTELFHMTRIACMRAIVNQFTEEAEAVLAGLEDDPDEEVRGAVESALEFLRERD